MSGLALPVLALTLPPLVDAHVAVYFVIGAPFDEADPFTAELTIRLGPA